MLTNRSARFRQDSVEMAARVHESDRVRAESGPSRTRRRLWNS